MKYIIILLSLVLSARTLNLSYNFMLIINGMLDGRAGPRNLLYCRLWYMNLYKTKVYLCRRSIIETDKVMNLLHFSSNKTSDTTDIFICKLLIGDIPNFVLDGTDEFIFVHNLTGVKTHNGASIISANKSVQWFNCTIFDYYFLFPIWGRRKFVNCLQSSLGFHKIKKRSIYNGNYQSIIDSYHYIDGYGIPYSTTDYKEISRSEKYEYELQQDFLKNKIQKIIAENGHLILNCPEVTMESKVEWYKNYKKLNYTFRNNMAETEKEPNLTIDAYNSLYILQATKEEEGNYTCYVDGKPFQDFYVKVVSKSKLLNQEFFRYSIYLGFVLSLTITCYCAGICVAWHRRGSFADPLYLSLTNK